MLGNNLTDPSLAEAHLANPDRLWPLGLVEYKFYRTFPPKHQTMVRKAMDYITERTPCVNFVQGNSDSINYVTIIPTMYRFMIPVEICNQEPVCGADPPTRPPVV